MPLTPAERAKRYRDRKKENESTYSEYLRKERERYKRRKEEGKVTLIADMNQREKRHQRKTWRIKKQKERDERRKTESNMKSYTPPSSPNSPFPIQLVNPSRKKKRKDRAKAYRELNKLKEKIEIQQKTIERYRKRLYRQKVRERDVNSPRTKTKSLLKGQRVATETKRALLFHHALVKGIKDKYQKTKSIKYRQLIMKTISSGLIRKYRLQKLARQQLSLPKRSIVNRNSMDIEYTRKRRNNKVVESMRADVEQFLCREDNSRVKAGKKATMTKSKQKKQIHLLNDTLRNLHVKYLSENSTRKMSYSFFCRLKPFYVRNPTSSDRETCLCKRHENLQFKVNKLRQLKMLDSTDLQTLATSTTCSVNSLSCMYRQCQDCSNKRVQTTGDFEDGKMVEWFEWKTRKIEKTTSHGSDIKVATMTLKEKEKGTINTLILEFQEEMNKCLRHIYNITHQYKAIRSLKTGLDSSGVLVHVDFSENLSCKYESEIQSVHFGASQRQISLHTGVLYFKEKSQSFCSISDNLKHGPAAIWSQLQPVLEYVRAENPAVTNLYVLSDGPTTQYRNRENFYLMTKVPFELGFKLVNWSFMEAGHGKGAPDGVGAAIKREADRAVLHGNDVVDGQSLKESLLGRNISVKLFMVNNSDISRYEEILQPLTIKPVPGTMKIHQIFSTQTGEIHHRDVSCFCKTPEMCSCYSPTKIRIHDVSPNVVQQSQPSVSSLEANNEFDETMKGRYCVVKYDKKPFPGIIVDVDDGEVEVQVMSSIGRNKFFWPMIEDVLWYKKSNFVRLIEPLEKVTSRHFQISKDVWAEIERELGLDT